MYKVGREVKDSQLVKEAFYPHGIEGFGHVEEHRACQPPLAEARSVGCRVSLAVNMRLCQTADRIASGTAVISSSSDKWKRICGRYLHTPNIRQGEVWLVKTGGVGWGNGEL